MRAASRIVPSPPTTTTTGARASTAAAIAASRVDLPGASTIRGGMPVRDATADAVLSRSRARVPGSPIRAACAFATTSAGTSDDGWEVTLP